MYLMLPFDNNYTLDDVLENLTGDVFRGILQANSTKRVNLRFPKFTLKKRTPVHETLFDVSIQDQLGFCFDKVSRRSCHDFGDLPTNVTGKYIGLRRVGTPDRYVKPYRQIV